jgi:putative DNA methylase
MKIRKKLIEVALPLEAINAASAKEKNIRHGHPSTLHLWWARRPLAAARAVIFGQMVDDPSALPELFPTERAQQKERQRLFKIIEDLVKWDNTTNDRVLQAARDEVWQSWRRACADNADHPRAKELFNRHKLPAFHDPFAGGGALPLEAQRLGLEAYASDLNPVAVLINKAMIEVPPKFAGMPPVNPDAQRHAKELGKVWQGAQGLAEDVRYYGEWMRNEAKKRIGHLYPKIDVTSEMAKDRPDLKSYVGKKLTVIAWLWARTVKSPNPAFANVEVPLASSFLLSTKVGKEAYVEPVIEGRKYRFKVKIGKPKDMQSAKDGTKVSRGSFRCLLSGVPIGYEYIDQEANKGRMGAKLMAIVAEGDKGRLYLPPTEAAEGVAYKATPAWKPDAPSRGTWASNAQGRVYGFRTFGDYFTARQLVALTTFCDLVEQARLIILKDGVTAGLSDDVRPLAEGGKGAVGYADAVSLYLGFAVDKAADYWSTICTWHSSKELIRNTFGRQGIAMTWDYAETNCFSESAGNISSGLEWSQKVLCTLPASVPGFTDQADAQTQSLSKGKVVSTDPPYYDNIGYADLSDYFYVWLRRALRCVFPGLFPTVAVPKAEELVACSYRHGGAQNAEKFFLHGMTKAIRRLADLAHHAFPVTIYYAFKQSEMQDDAGVASSGWDVFLDAVLHAGFGISGTWPVRTELANKLIGMDANMLASSVVLVCRPQDPEARTATRREFITVMKSELPVALMYLQRSNIAPVDLAQAAIGPGMEVYTRFSKVVDASGKELPVREALALINQTLDEVLAEQEGDFDAETRWSLAWFEQSGFAEGEYGVAETLSKAKNTSVNGMVEADIVAAGRGKVRLKKPSELSGSWDPERDKRLTAWETVHQLVRALESGGEDAAAVLVAKLGSRAETARELAYRLYTICDRKKRQQEALSYNGLVQSWPEISRLALQQHKVEPTQTKMFQRT